MFLVGQVRQQRVSEQVERQLQSAEILWRADEIDQRPVHALEHIVNHVVLLLQPVDHRGETGVRPAQMRVDLGVFERMALGHGPAVGRAVGPERPVVLPHGHLIDHRPGRARADSSRLHLLDDVPKLIQVQSQVIMDVDQVLPPRDTAAS